MRSAQLQVELRRLVSQLPVLGKANSVCKVVNLKVKSTFCNKIHCTTETSTPKKKERNKIYKIRRFYPSTVVVIINFWLLLMASSRRTYTATEAARHILEGDGCELHRIDVD